VAYGNAQRKKMKEEGRPHEETRRERSDDTRPKRSDEQIIDRVRAGDTRLFTELVQRYQDAVYGMAKRFVASSADAEDIAQEAFLRVHRGLEGFKGDARFSTWLYRITYNLCADWIRRRRKHGRASIPIEDTGDIEDRRGGFEDRLLDEEERRRVRGALERLDDKYRTVIMLLYDQSLSYEEIAAVLEMPVKTVETRLYRARRILRASLEGRKQGGRS
jgi:RNA polymerase sigma-70 factor (ECF subfamily)